MDLYIAFCCLIFVRLINANQTIPKKNMNEISRGTPRNGKENKTVPRFNGFIPMADLQARVQPLPKPKKDAKFLQMTHTTLYQGVKRKNDRRVFRQTFEYKPMSIGQQIVCNGLFDCVVAAIMMESTEGIPVLLRGGVGYRHFTVVVKSKPNKELKGQVRAYCRNDGNTTDKPQLKPKRRFYFGDRFNDEDNSS